MFNPQWAQSMKRNCRLSASSRPALSRCWMSWYDGPVVFYWTVCWPSCLPLESMMALLSFTGVYDGQLSSSGEYDGQLFSTGEYYGLIVFHSNGGDRHNHTYISSLKMWVFRSMHTRNNWKSKENKLTKWILSCGLNLEKKKQTLRTLHLLSLCLKQEGMIQWHCCYEFLCEWLLNYLGLVYYPYVGKSLRPRRYQ